MSEHREISSPAEESEEFGRVLLIREKILTAWGTAKEQLGSANVHRTAEILYAALYDPKRLDHLDIPPTDTFPDRKKILVQPISDRPESIPTLEQFLPELRRAMTEEVDFRAALYPEAFHTMEQLGERGRLTIWTAGDMVGFPEQGAPGSRQQMKKLLLAGLQDFRKIQAEKHGVGRQEILNILAAEDKFSVLEQYQHDLQQRGVDHVTVIDDRLEALQRAEAALSGPLEVFPVWVRQGKYRDTIDRDSDMASAVQRYHAVDRLDQLLTKLPPDNVDSANEFLLDYDGVLSNDERRAELQTDAVIAKLRQHHWI